MTDTTTSLGPSWLSSTPDGAVIVRRTITQYTVVELLDGHIGARPEGRRRLEYFDMCLVADHDAPIVRPGARFWLVAERVAGRPGEGYSAIAFRRPGALSPARAFAARTGPRGDPPPLRLLLQHPTRPSEGVIVTEVQPFVFPATGQPVRTAVIDGEPLVCHADICALLDHSNPSVAIRLVDEDDKRLIDTSDIRALNKGISGNARTWFLTEPGFYTLALTSQAPGAKALRRWIAHEVLPTLRRTGSYSVPPEPAPVRVEVSVNALAELAHQQHVVPAAARILAYARWRKPRKGIQAFVQLAIDVSLPGVEGGFSEVKALPADRRRGAA